MNVRAPCMSLYQCSSGTTFRYGGGFGARDYRQNHFRGSGGGGGGMHQNSAPRGGAPHGAQQQHASAPQMFQPQPMMAFPNHYGGGYGGSYTTNNAQATDWWGS